MSASERITDAGRVRLRGLLDAGDPYGEVRDAWHAKETLRGVYDIDDAEVGAATVASSPATSRTPPCPQRSTGSAAPSSAGAPRSPTGTPPKSPTPPPKPPTLIKRVKRAAFGFTNFANYRIRALLYAGKPNWGLLDTLTPPKNAESHIPLALVFAGVLTAVRICCPTRNTFVVPRP